VSSCAVKVFLVAENRLLRESLVRLFQKRADISVVAENHYSNLEKGQIVASECGILLLDSLTAAHATGLIDELHELAPQIKIVLFGMDEDPECFLKAVRSGVCGYILKDASATDLIAAIRGVSQGEAVCPPRLCMPLFELVSQAFRQRSGMTDQQACLNLGLTYRQQQIVALVARGLTNKEIASSLNLSEFTVKNHIHRIMRQVDAESRYEVVNVIRAGGYLPVA
jgi:DNA-binding NarL/FixJ family response regulator